MGISYTTARTTIFAISALLLLALAGCNPTQAQLQTASTRTTLDVLSVKATRVPTITFSPSHTATSTSIPTSSPTQTPTSQPTDPPTATPFAGGGQIAYWDYSGPVASFFLTDADGKSSLKIFSIDELAGDHHPLMNPPGFSPDGCRYLFQTFENDRGTLNLIVLDTQENQAEIVQSFDLSQHILPMQVYWLSDDAIVYSTVDDRYPGDFDSFPAQIYTLELEAGSTPIHIPLGGEINHVEAVLPEGALLVSTKKSMNDPGYIRRIIAVTGEVVAELDIDRKISAVIGRAATGELLSNDINFYSEAPTPLQVAGDQLYLKKCAQSADFFTCHLLKVGYSTSEVSEVFRTPGESIWMIEVSPDRERLLCRQCRYLSAYGAVGTCALRAYELDTGEPLFEIKNGSNPAWSPDGQYFIYLDYVLVNSRVESSTLMRAARDSSETIPLAPDNQMVGEPAWPGQGTAGRPSARTTRP